MLCVQTVLYRVGRSDNMPVGLDFNNFSYIPVVLKFFQSPRTTFKHREIAKTQVKRRSRLIEIITTTQRDLTLWEHFTHNSD